MNMRSSFHPGTVIVCKHVISVLCMPESLRAHPSAFHLGCYTSGLCFISPVLELELASISAEEGVMFSLRCQLYQSMYLKVTIFSGY